MKTNLLIAGGAVVAGAAVFAAVSGKRQSNGPATQAAAAAVFAREEKESPAARQSTDLISIVHLETRDRLVTIQSAGDGLVYRVESKDGKVLHENLSEEQLKAQAPETYELIKTSVAGSGTKDDWFMDARLGR